MTDTEGFRGPDQGAPPPAPPPRRMACPRCRGTFEGDPDVCPHCGLAKTDIPAISQPVGTTAAAPQPAPAPPAPAPPPVEVAPAPAEEAHEDVEQPRGRKPARLLIAGAVALLAAGGAAWWLTKGGVEEDPCAAYRAEMAQVEAREHANSREERRAVAEVADRAHDAGCDLGDPATSGEDG